MNKRDVFACIAALALVVSVVIAITPPVDKKSEPIESSRTVILTCKLGVDTDGAIVVDEKCGLTVIGEE